MLTVNTYRGIGGLELIAPGWETLTKAAGHGGFGASYTSLESLLRYRHPAPGSVNFIVIGKEPDHPLAIFPLERGRARIKRVNFNAWIFPEDPDRPTSDFAIHPSCHFGSIFQLLKRELHRLDSARSLLVVDKAEESGGCARLAEAIDTSHTVRVQRGEVARISVAGTTFEELAGRSSQKFRANLRRSVRKLGEGRGLSREVSAGGPGLERALEEFIELEGRGWKYERAEGNALRKNQAALSYTRAMSVGLSAQSRVEIHGLRFKGKSIAMGICVRGGREVYFYKTAYDESFTESSPGHLLTESILRRYVEDSGVDWVNLGWEPIGFEGWKPERTIISTTYFSLGGLKGDLAMRLLRIE